MTQHVLALDVELDELRAAVVRLQSENERLLRLLRLSPQEAAAPGPAQSGMFEGHNCVVVLNRDCREDLVEEGEAFNAAASVPTS